MRYRKDFLNVAVYLPWIPRRCPCCLAFGGMVLERRLGEPDGERTACRACGFAWIERRNRRNGANAIVEGLRDADLP